MPSTPTTSLLLPLLALTLSGCIAQHAPPVILDGGHYHPAGADVSPLDGSPDYTVKTPIYVIPEDTFRALMEL